jgi:two-component system NtrC family sensor kinase
VIRYHLEASGVTIEEDFATDIGFIPLDEEQMKQVFLNLVSNAFQAMPEGGKLNLRTARAGDKVTVSFADTGTGIAPENMDRVFDPFFTTSSAGTGLGLSVSLGIVQEHGGQITVESEEGQGSTFTVWLPAGTGAGDGKGS